MRGTSIIRWLARLYPPAWRARYADEFEQLLLDELGERKPAAGWWLDLAGHAVLARLEELGVAGDVEENRRLDGVAGLAAAAIVLAWFCGAAMWAQLAVGWQWSAPTGASTRTAEELITAGLIGLGIAAGWLAGGAFVAAVRGGRLTRRGPLLALAIFCVCALALVLGSGWMGLSWPGSGGHAWAGRALVPAWLGRRAWALTLWLSTYWAHPRQLGGLGPTQVGWMILSPLLVVATVCCWRATVGPVCRWRPPRRVVCGAVLIAGASTFVIASGAAARSLDGRAGPHGLFVPGTIDVGLLIFTGLLSMGCAMLARRVLLTPETRLSS
jgi:hypothetical protein